jgi:hypothetical protein
MLEFQQSRISTQSTSSMYGDDLVVGLIIRLKMVKELILWFFLGTNTHTHTHTHIYTYIYTSLNPVPNAQVCVYLTVHITKPDMQYKFFKQLSKLMVTHWKSNVEIWQSFTIFSPHFWLLKPSKITSFLNFWIFHFTFQRNFSGKNNGIKGLSGRICHRGPNP